MIKCLTLPNNWYGTRILCIPMSVFCASLGICAIDLALPDWSVKSKQEGYRKTLRQNRAEKVMQFVSVTNLDFFLNSWPTVPFWCRNLFPRVWFSLGKAIRPFISPWHKMEGFNLWGKRQPNCVLANSMTRAVCSICRAPFIINCVHISFPFCPHPTSPFSSNC